MARLGVPGSPGKVTVTSGRGPAPLCPDVWAWTPEGLAGWGKCRLT